MNAPGVCYLVGAGPGDIGLFTLRAREIISKADVLIYDYLANPAALAWAPREAELIYVGDKGRRLSQEEINRVLVEKGKAGGSVVRLKGGDPYLFGRGGEEGEALKKAGVDFEVVPGVTSALAASAYAGVPLTHRDFSSCVTFVTGHEDPLKESSGIRWKALVESGATLAIYMGMGRISTMMETLVKNGLSKEVPVAVIQWGATPRQRSATGTVGDIVKAVKEEGLGAPAVIVVGEVVKLSRILNWLERKPLFGKKVLVTRTREQASRLSTLLTERGAEVLEFPMIRIEPVKDVLRNMKAPGAYDWFVFTSPNAVKCFLNAFCAERDVRELGSAKIAVVGPSTGKILTGYGLKTAFQPDKFTAKDLVEQWPAEEKGKRVLFPCGNLAKDEIEEGLRRKGAEVDRLEVYRTVPEVEHREGARERFCQEGADWVIFSSSSAVENFHALNLEYPKEKCRYACLGPVTAGVMRKWGYSVDLEAEESRIEKLVEQLESS